MARGSRTDARAACAGLRFLKGGHRDGATGTLQSVRPVEVSADAARRFLVARHLLAPARSVEGGPDASASRWLGSSSSTRCRSPAGTTTSCCTRALPATTRRGAKSSCTSGAEPFEAYNSARCADE